MISPNIPPWSCTLVSSQCQCQFFPSPSRNFTRPSSDLVRMSAIWSSVRTCSTYIDLSLLHTASDEVKSGVYMLASVMMMHRVLTQGNCWLCCQPWSWLHAAHNSAVELHTLLHGLFLWEPSHQILTIEKHCTRCALHIIYITRQSTVTKAY